jgi:site-specific recombinase XerD
MPVDDFEAKVEATLENIHASEEIHPRNKNLLEDYKRDQVLNGLSNATIARNLGRLKVLAENPAEEPFDSMDKDGVKGLVEWVHRQEYTDSTVETYKSVVRSFWTWLKGDESGKPPEEVAWIQTKNSQSNGKLPKDLLTKAEVRTQIEAAHNPRDKALIAMLYETGARIGELIDLTVGDIEDRDHGKKVVLDGKTGARRVPLVESVPYLNKWLNSHPGPIKEAPLWCKLQQGGPDDQLGYRYILEKILKKTMEEAEIDKPANPHHYRHSRASHLATEFTEAELCEWFGWVQGSDVPARYVHLSGRDLDNSYDKMHGLWEPDEDEQEPDVTECPRCQELNEPDAKFCMRCGFALDQETAGELEERVETEVKKSYRDADPDDEETFEKLEVLEEILGDPQVKQALLTQLSSG